TGERQVRTLTAADLTGPVRTVATVRVPKGFSPRNAAAKRDLASAMRSALARPRPEPAEPEAADAVRDDATITALRRRLRAHPCHGCSEREDHARWAERHERLRKEHDALVRRIEGRTSSIARVFDKVCDVLTVTGHLEVADGRTRVTEAGQALRRIYAESDLLVAECLRAGAWDGLDAPALAAVVSAVVYESRRDEPAVPPHVPGGPGGRIGRALDATQRVWSRLEDLESARGIPTTRPPDAGLVQPVHTWASGRGLGAVLQG